MHTPSPPTPRRHPHVHPSPQPLVPEISHPAEQANQNGYVLLTHSDFLNPNLSVAERYSQIVHHPGLRILGLVCCRLERCRIRPAPGLAAGGKSALSQRLLSLKTAAPGASPPTPQPHTHAHHRCIPTHAPAASHRYPKSPTLQNRPNRLLYANSI